MNHAAARNAPSRRPSRGAALRTIAATATVATALTLTAASTASAESIVFIKDANVWLTSPDGARQHQVTADGTAESPYRSPSQADDGTIAVSHQNLIKRIQQNGQVLNTIDPPPLVDSTSRPVDGTPVAVAISPDGSKIAYSFSSYSCPIVWECGARAVTGVTFADRFTPAGTFASATFGNPRWVGSNRLIVTGGHNYHVNLLDVAAGSSPAHWIDDRYYFDDNSDLGEAVVSRDGRRLAAVHGYDGEWPGSVRRIIWFNTSGDVIGGALPPARPAPVCITSPVRGTHSPTWSPTGSGMAFTLPEGLHVAQGVPTDGAQCGAYRSSLLVPGATEPDWGPAAINPQPIPVPAPTPTPTPTPTPKKPAPKKPSSKAKKATLAVVGTSNRRSVARNGMSIRVRGLASGKRVTVRLRVNAATAKRLKLGRKAATLGSGSAKASKQGTATVRLKLGKKAAGTVRKHRRTISATLTAPGATAKKVTLR